MHLPSFVYFYFGKANALYTNVVGKAVGLPRQRRQSELTRDTKLKRLRPTPTITVRAKREFFFAFGQREIRKIGITKNFLASVPLFQFVRRQFWLTQDILRPRKTTLTCFDRTVPSRPGLQRKTLTHLTILTCKRTKKTFKQ